MQLEAEIYIHAARGSVWRYFANIKEWPAWRHGILSASWQQSQPWEEGSLLQVEQRTWLGRATKTAEIKMSVPENRVVWEVQTGGVSVVTTAQFRDDLGGCTVRLRKSYHGPLVFFLKLVQPRIKGQMASELATLKAQIERT